MPDDVNEAAVDRLVARATAVPGVGKVRSAFSGTRGLSPTAVAAVSAVPGVVVVIVALASGRPLLLIVAVAAMAITMVVVMTKVNATRVVAEVKSEVVVLASQRGELSVLGRLPLPLTLLPGGGRSWLRVQAGDELLWVSRPAFGGIVHELAEPAADEPSGVDPPAADA